MNTPEAPALSGRAIDPLPGRAWYRSTERKKRRSCRPRGRMLSRQVGMSGEPEAREERGLSPWQFAVRRATWSSESSGFDRRLSALSIRGRFYIPCIDFATALSREAKSKLIMRGLAHCGHAYSFTGPFFHEPRRTLLPQTPHALPPLTVGARVPSRLTRADPHDVASAPSTTAA